MAWLAGAGEWEETSGGARFEPLGMPGAFDLGVRDGCLRVLLEPRPGRAAIDVSVQPSVLDHAVRRSAEMAGVDPAVASHRVAERLTDLVAVHGLRVLPDAPLLAVVGAASFPVLHEPYRRGRHALRDVPRWAAGALRQPDARAAARQLFGDRTTRRVVAALARRLVGEDVVAADPGGTVDLFRVGVAHAAAPALDPDRLAGLLELDGALVPPERWPRVDDLRLASRVLGGVEANRLARWLADVVAHERPDAAFAELVQALHDVRHHLPARLPGRRDDIVALCRALTPLDPRGPAAVGVEPLPARAPSRPRVDGSVRVPAAATPPTPPAQARPTAPAAGDGRSRALVAPQVGPRVVALAASSPDRPLPRPPWAGAVDGAALPDGLRLELPRTPSELRAWGRLLGSCVGDFGPAALAGRSVLVGIRRHGHLVACCELTPAGTIRQLLGPRNRRVPDPVVAAVVAHLVAAGAVDRRAAQNHPWLERG